MKEQVLRHIQTVGNMLSSNLPLKFIGDYGEEKSRQACAWIMGQGIAPFADKISVEAKRYFMCDPEVAARIKEMTAEGESIFILRLEQLFVQAKQEKLSVFDSRDIEEVVRDMEIPMAAQFYFLKYYKKIELEKGERGQLLENLGKYVRTLSLDMAELTEKERALLFNPLFTMNQLNSVLNDREVWQVLVEPELPDLLSFIGMETYDRLKLGKEQIMEMAKSVQETREYLKKVMRHFDEACYPQLLELWLSNGALLSDLKCLEKLLPDMTEERKKEMLGGRVAYACALHQTNLENIDIFYLSQEKEEVLLYAILTGKKHFLKLVNDNSGDFLALSSGSFLLDPDIYRNYLNLNTLNERNLQDSYGTGGFGWRRKELLNRKSYTFEELYLLSSADSSLCRLYGYLSSEKSDVRLRTFREIVKNVPSISSMEEEKLRSLAARLSEKPLSMWMHGELAHIAGLEADLAAQLLADWETYGRFVPEIENVRQAVYLIRNRAVLAGLETLGSFQENMLTHDETWLWLKEKLSITDEFVQEHEARIRQFVYDGNAEIVREFCVDNGQKWEAVRRLLCAELMGEFAKLKYHETDLEKEIAYPVSEETESTWKEKLMRSMGDLKLWEEDRFIPVFQIGEIPTHTCLSYRNGIYRSCLLSCFDSNKKVLYLKKGDVTVFRALLRLTKGSVTEKPVREQKIEFADLTKEKAVVDTGKEELVLFLERPYFSRISEAKEDEIVSFVYQMVQEKAAKLHARVVISRDYAKYEASDRFERKDYYVYISASKNGKQYLDSLGGEATVSSSGLYGKNSFLMEKGEAEKAA